MEQTILNLQHLSKSFDGKKILDDLSIDIGKNEFVTLLGPSGCGKTTTLRMIGGFVMPDEGRVIFEGRDITDLPPDKRHINTVFQKYSLFSHMSVGENIAFGLKLKKKSSGYIRDKIDYALKLVDLEGYEDRHPMSLSGGQQQRIAIVNEPKVLLLDEPLGALDLKLRQEMQKELIKIKNELSITFVFVTHDQEEALTMSDRIIVMNQGLIQQVGTPVDIYNEPQNAFVADFIGESNIVDGIMPKDCLVYILGCEFPCIDSGFAPNELVDVVIRPEDIEFREPGEGMLDGVVTSILFKGVHYEMKVQAGGFEWLAHSTAAHQPGTEIGLYVKPENIQIMHKPSSSAQEVIKKNE